MKEIFQPDGALNRFVVSAGDALWTYVLIALLVGCAIWFTIKTRAVQFRRFGEMLRLIGTSGVGKKDEKTRISSFQAFAVSMATRVGTGNLAGVATAITIGGPGAVFWMWVMALLGSATSFVECTLAQIFKKKEKESFIGGPAYYIKKGLGKGWLATLFALLVILNFGFSNNSIQANTICTALDGAFGLDPLWGGILLTGLCLFVIFGGIHRISKVSSVVVPIMALGYLILAIFIICRHLGMIPEVLGIIVKDAFGIEQIAGGGIGVTIMTGVRRGLFSNEAGEGSVPNVAATADVSHPVKQGLIQAFGVFVDTIVVCSCTAFIILFSGVNIVDGDSGITLTQQALSAEIGKAGSIFVAIAVFLFAYSTIIGNYYYVESNVRYLTPKKWILTIIRIFAGGVCIIFGSMASLDLVWNLGDLTMGLVTIINVVAILLLGKYAFRAMKDYFRQKKDGVGDPVFKRDEMKELDLECWE